MSVWVKESRLESSEYSRIPYDEVQVRDTSNVKGHRRQERKSGNSLQFWRAGCMDSMDPLVVQVRRRCLLRCVLD